MTYRPYPNAARALRQLDRHRHAPQTAPQLPPMPRFPDPEQARRALEAAGAVVRPISEAMQRVAAAAARRAR